MGKIRKISATGSEPVKTALTVQKTVGATSITVSSIDGWHTGTGSDDEVPFVIYAVKPTGEIIAGSQSSWMGVVSRSSSTINNLRLTGGQDQIYPVGSKVVATSTAAWANELAEALLASHNPDGSLKTQDVPDNSIDGVKLKDNTIDGAKIKDGSIEPGKLSTDMGVYSARTDSLSSPIQGAIQNLANNGAKITLNLKSSARVLVTVFVGMKSTSDFEFRPAILVNGVEKYREEIPASLATSGRAVQRSAQVAFGIPAGTQIISAGVLSASATNQEIPAGAASISVIVFK